LINGQSLSRRLADPASNLTKLANTPKISYAEIIEEVYLLVLCRLPESAEMAAMQRHFAAAPNKLQADQDAMWVLFNTKEFLFNH